MLYCFPSNPWWIKTGFFVCVFDLTALRLCCCIGIFSYGMWDLVPWPGIEPGPVHCKQHGVLAWSLNHWATREVPPRRDVWWRRTEWKFSGCWPLVLMTIIPPVPSWVVTQDSSAVPLSMHLFAFIRKHFPGNGHPMSLCACEWIEWEEGRVVEDFFFLSFLLFYFLETVRGTWCCCWCSGNCYNQSYFKAKN